MDTIIKYLPVLLPVIVIELTLAIFSFIHVLRLSLIHIYNCTIDTTKEY